jgi:hypothetical protein
MIRSAVGGDMSGEFERFKSYCTLAKQLIDAMDKEQVAECLRVMAVHLAEYQRRFAEIPRQDLLEQREQPRSQTSKLGCCAMGWSC